MAAHRALALLALVAVGLVGCASLERLPDPPAYASWSRPLKAAGLPGRRVLIPKTTTAEYLRSWGVRLVNTEPAFRAGYTGKGVTVAVIDTGLKWAQPEVADVASAASIDLIETRAADSQGAEHGAAVAGGVSAALNGDGLVGVAYGATLLSIRADIDGTCLKECTFRTRDLARGMDYALSQGARVIVLAVQGRRRLSPTFEAALQRIADAGAVAVIAAGNEAADEPTWPARYAADPRFAKAVVAVGASQANGQLAIWSNRAGASQERFIAAPGEKLYVNCDAKFCRQVSGTSYSTAYVAGALALILEARPDLTAQAAAEALLKGGRTDLVKRARLQGAGRGFLDVGRAVDAVRRRGPVLAEVK